MEGLNDEVNQQEPPSTPHCIQHSNDNDNDNNNNDNSHHHNDDNHHNVTLSNVSTDKPVAGYVDSTNKINNNNNINTNNIGDGNHNNASTKHNTDVNRNDNTGHNKNNIDIDNYNPQAIDTPSDNNDSSTNTDHSQIIRLPQTIESESDETTTTTPPITTTITTTTTTTTNMTQDQDDQPPVTIVVANPNSDNPTSPDHPNARIYRGRDRNPDTISSSPKAAPIGDPDEEAGRGSSSGLDRVTQEVDVVLDSCDEKGGRGELDRGCDSGKENGIRDDDDISKDLVTGLDHKEDLNEDLNGSGGCTDSVHVCGDNEGIGREFDRFEIDAVTDGYRDVESEQIVESESIDKVDRLDNYGTEGDTERHPSISSIDSEKINAYVSEITNKALTSYRDHILQQQQQTDLEESEQDVEGEANSKRNEENKCGADDDNDKDRAISENEEATQVTPCDTATEPVDNENGACVENNGEENVPNLDGSDTQIINFEESNAVREEKILEHSDNCSNTQEKTIPEDDDVNASNKHEQSQGQQRSSDEDHLDNDASHFESTPPADHQSVIQPNSPKEGDHYDSLSSSPLPPLSPSPPLTSSSPVTMNYDDGRPRTRPKSSHPRRRGQQDTDHLVSNNPAGIQTNGHDGSNQSSFTRSPSPDIRSASPIVRSPSPAMRSESPTKRAQSPSVRSQSPGDLSRNSSEYIIATNDRNFEEFNKDENNQIGSQEQDFHGENGIHTINNNRDDASPSPDKGERHSVMSPSLSKSPCNDRLSRIADAADNIAGMQDDLQQMFREAKEVLTHYQTQLNSQSIVEFSQDAPEFTTAFSSLLGAYKVCENVTGNIDHQLHDIRTATSQICDLITNKASSEDLDDFMQNKDSNTRDMESVEREAANKEQQARLEELKAITAKAAAQAKAAYELAAQAEVKATQADVAATTARKEAEITMKKMEEAKIAAEKKRRKDEEEARRLAEEKAKREEEERRRKEEEERRLAREAEVRGTSKEEERRRYLEEKKRLEAERKNPNNWPRHIYSIEGGDWNPGVGLILRAQQGSLDRDELEITLVDQMDSCLPLGENEELISNIMCLRPVDPEKSFKFEEPMSVSIPHCSSRIPPGREPVVKLMTSEGKLSTLSTHDLIFDDIKELKFVEVRLRQFGTMAVFLRSKKEHLTLNKMGGKVISGVDSRVTITSCENAFRTHASFTMEVQPIDQNLVLELRVKKPDPCGNLMATSPILGVQMTTKFHKPLTVTLPCPPNPALRPRRPQTATTRLAPSPPTEKQDPKDRPLSARMFPAKEEPETDELHLLRKDGEGSWTRTDDVILTHTKKKDIVSFDLTNPFNKLVLVRTKAGLSGARVEKILSHVIVALTFKPVSVIMRQKSRDPNMVTVTCAQSTNVERVIKSLGEEGYDHGPKPSPDILLTEGQRLALRFRGNLILTDDEFSRGDFKFCNHIPFRLNFTVTEHDKYAQKGFSSYRGFSQIYTRGKVRRPSMAADDRDWATGQRVKDEYVDGDILVCEQLIIIPKPDPETPRPLNITPVTLTSEGVVNDEMLRFLSTHLQNNDWKRLAAQLNVRRSRIQAILRQNINNSTTQTVYDILVTWSKRLPRAVNRTDILCKNLSSIGRDDLAEELRVRDEEYRQAKHLKARESYLKKAFVAIARNPLAVAQWKHLARYLEVEEDEIQHIESTHGSCQESCLASLIRWKDFRGEEATIPLLATKLRRCRYRKLAREIEDIR